MNLQTELDNLHPMMKAAIRELHKKSWYMYQTHGTTKEAFWNIFLKEMDNIREKGGVLEIKTGRKDKKPVCFAWDTENEKYCIAKRK
jgi:hypothetical protein